MYHSIVLSTFTLLITVVASMPTYSNDIESEFFTEVDNLKDSFELQSLSALSVDEVGGNLRYTFGKRSKYDRLVSQNTDKSIWPSPQNVTLILQYPSHGNGAIVTFIEIIVNQSSSIGAARVIAGGIGKRSFASVVEGNRTYWFNYAANIYGI